MNLDILVAVIEWTWTLLALFGVAVCLWALIDSYGDRAEQRRKKFNGGAALVVGMILRGARASMLLHTFFLALGFFALATPDQRFTPALGILGAGYILVAATNARAILLNQIDRVRMRRKGA
jgi:hypothetical protein